MPIFLSNRKLSEWKIIFVLNLIRNFPVSHWSRVYSSGRVLDGLGSQRTYSQEYLGRRQCVFVSFFFIKVELSSSLTLLTGGWLLVEVIFALFTATLDALLQCTYVYLRNIPTQYSSLSLLADIYT